MELEAMPNRAHPCFGCFISTIPWSASDLEEPRKRKSSNNQRNTTKSMKGLPKTNYPL